MAFDDSDETLIGAMRRVSETRHFSTFLKIALCTV